MKPGDQKNHDQREHAIAPDGLPMKNMQGFVQQDLAQEIGGQRAYNIAKIGPAHAAVLGTEEIAARQHHKTKGDAVLEDWAKYAKSDGVACCFQLAPLV